MNGVAARRRRHKTPASQGLTSSAAKRYFVAEGHIAVPFMVGFLTYMLKISDPDTLTDELLPEYRFDYSKARPNRFARPEAAPNTINLDADVAAVFTTEESVNTVLRALIQATPQPAAR